MTTSSAPRSLRSNFSWTAFGNIIYAACQWGVITVLANLGTPVMVGQFALAIAITDPIVQFFNLQLRGVQATDAKREYTFSDYLTLRAVTSSGAFLVTLGILLFGGYPGDTIAVIILVAVAKWIDSFSDVFYGLFQQREQMDIISRALVSNGVISLILLTVGVLVSGDLLLGVVGYVVGSFVPLVFYTLPTSRRILTAASSEVSFGLRCRPDVILQLARTAFPLGIVMLLISLNTNIPRYFVEATLGEHGLGVFAALAYLMVAGTTFVSALGQAVSPRLSQHYALGRIDLFQNMLIKLMAFGLALGIVGALLAFLVGPQVVTLLYTAEYADHQDVLIVLALAAGFSFAASFAGYGMTAARYFKAQVPVFCIVLAAGVAASALLIPKYGLVGASVALLVAAIVQLTASAVVVARAARVNEGKNT